MSETNSNLLEGEFPEDESVQEAIPETETQQLRREIAETRAQVAHVVNILRERTNETQVLQQPVPPPLAPPLPQERIEAESTVPAQRVVVERVNPAPATPSTPAPAKQPRDWNKIKELFVKLHERSGGVAMGALIGTFFTPVIGTVAGAAIGASRKPKDS